MNDSVGSFDEITVPPCEGERYEMDIPDTLDLAERGEYALNALIGMLDPNLNYEIWFHSFLGTNPPYMYHDTTGLPTNNPKFAESFPLMRVMTGNERNLDMEEGMMGMMVGLIAEDGLYYAPVKEERPWHEGVGHVYRTADGEIVHIHEDFANVYGNARMMLAMMAWYQRDRNPIWLTRIENMARGLAKIAVYKDDYAYFPDSEIGEAFSYPKSGWRSTEEPATERMGAEGSTLMYHGGEIRALSRLYAITGDAKTLELARKLKNFVMKPKFWGIGEKHEGAERAHWSGHPPGRLSTLRGLLEYAIVTNDSSLKAFVRSGYEYTRTHYAVGRIGWLLCGGCGCSIPRLLALAIRLTDAGLGDFGTLVSVRYATQPKTQSKDYWEDVDGWIRNQQTEQQILDIDLARKVSEAGEEHIAKPPKETSDRVLERCLGGFPIYGRYPTLTSSDVHIGGCCMSNNSQGLYYVWESIVRCVDGIAQVNLLLNRASPWLNVDSCLPYEGKVVIRNKTAKRLYVRIPLWVNRKEVQCHINSTQIAQPAKNNRRLALRWAYGFGNYLVFDALGEKDVVTIEFPMVETTEKYTVHDRQFTCQFRGNTLVDISPRPEGTGYPLYTKRSQYKAEKAPMKKVTRYVSPTIIQW